MQIEIERLIKAVKFNTERVKRLNTAPEGQRVVIVRQVILFNSV
jgi:hypothetical protein